MTPLEEHPTAVAINALLESIGAGAGSPGQRRNVALRIATGGFELADVELIVAKARSIPGMNAPGAFVWKYTRDEAAFADMVKGIRAEKAMAASPGAAAPTDNVQGSHVRYANASNPYGWAPRPLLGMQIHNRDHNLPGEWNAHRQCFNLTVEEARALGRGEDFRVRGCTRLAAIGEGEPEPEWDAAWDAPAEGRPDSALRRRDVEWSEDKGPRPQSVS